MKFQKRRLSEELEIDFIELGDIQPNKEDGVHVDSSEHQKISDEIYNYLLEEFLG